MVLEICGRRSLLCTLDDDGNEGILLNTEVQRYWVVQEIVEYLRFFSEALEGSLRP